MALPVQSTPTYQVTIPSTDEKVNFRPFLVKEEKALLLAQQSEDASVMVETLKGVLSGCLLGNVDVAKLALFDLEYLFTQIRGKSVGEDLELYFTCEHCEDDEGKNVVKRVLDLNEVKVTKNPKHKNKIELFDDVGMVLKYPDVEVMKGVDMFIDENNFDSMFEILVSSIDYIYDTDNIYHAHETPREELMEFVGNLTNEQFLKINEFFETMPRLTHHVEFDCPVCGSHNDRIVEGLANFF